MVERTITWIVRSRRMSTDDEFSPATSEARVYLNMVRLMLERLAHEQVQPVFHYRRVARTLMRSRRGQPLVPLLSSCGDEEAESVHEGAGVGEATLEARKVADAELRRQQRSTDVGLEQERRLLSWCF